MIIFRVMNMAIICAVVSTELTHPLSDEFINLINSKNTTWTARRNFRKDISFDYIKNLMGTVKDDFCEQLPEKRHGIDVIAKLPENFDSRSRWTNCPTLLEIRDQGSCSSCWAVAAVEAMTDRLCIYSNGTRHFHFSAYDVLSCCNDCGLGCYGGSSCKAWKYWQENGIVSGGEYDSSQGCQPYDIAPCDHHHVRVGRRPCSGRARTPKCDQSCEESYDYDYNEDKRYGQTVYRVKGDNQIRAEIYQNGPVEATFTVYSDFLNYSSGVYQHTTGEIIGLHSVKIIGWGVENDIKYWLIANSWNSDWGEDGFFKMIRGINHNGIEDVVVAGEPKLT